MNQEVADRQERAEVQAVVGEHRLLEERRCAAHVIGKLRVGGLREVLGQQRLRLRSQPWTLLVIPPFQVLAPRAVAKDFAGTPDSPPQLRMHALENLKEEL